MTFFKTNEVVKVASVFATANFQVPEPNRVEFDQHADSLL
jgi:hypothetical protein